MIKHMMAESTDYNLCYSNDYEFIVMDDEEDVRKKLRKETKVEKDWDSDILFEHILGDISEGPGIVGYIKFVKNYDYYNTNGVTLHEVCIAADCPTENYIEALNRIYAATKDNPTDNSPVKQLDVTVMA